MRPSYDIKQWLYAQAKLSAYVESRCHLATTGDLPEAVPHTLAHQNLTDLQRDFPSACRDVYCDGCLYFQQELRCRLTLREILNCVEPPPPSFSVLSRAICDRACVREFKHRIPLHAGSTQPTYGKASICRAQVSPIQCCNSGGS